MENPHSLAEGFCSSGGASTGSGVADSISKAEA